MKGLKKYTKLVPYLTSNKIDATMDRTYHPGIKRGTVALTTAQFYPPLLSFSK